MENTTGPIKVFFVGTLPKETYTDVNELARDIANSLAVDADSITVPLIPLADLKGEEGDEGPRGLPGDKGDKGDTGATGPAGVTGLSPFVPLAVVGATCTWTLQSNMPHQNASLQMIEGSGSIALTIVGATSGMRGTLKIKQNLACNGVLGLPSNSFQSGGGWLISHTIPPETPPTPPFIDILSWVYDGTSFYWTIFNNFVLTAP